VEINQPWNTKPKMRGHKLKGGINWQGALKKNYAKQKSI
jgi:hypothetical protein